MQVSSAVSGMSRSGIREIMDLTAGRPEVIHLEVGEPNFNTPQHVCDAAARAASEGFTKYTSNAGVPELREVLAEKVRARNHIQVSPSQVIVSAGAVSGLFAAMTALVEPGSEVLLGDPSWPSYVLMMQLQGVKPVYFPLEPERSFVPNVSDIEPLVSDRAKAIILNSPGNPTGSITPRETIQEILEFAKAHDLWVLSDEVYDEIWFDTPPVAMAPHDDEGRVVSFFSMSKTYAMTGWRVGYVVAPKNVSESIIKAQEPITSCVNAPAQIASIAAITGSQDCVKEMRQAYLERRDAVVGILDERNVPYVRPAGAIYVMIDVSSSGSTGTQFARRLVTEKAVAAVPGVAFGPTSDRYIRISLATEMTSLLEGVSRISDALDDWSP